MCVPLFEDALVLVACWSILLREDVVSLDHIVEVCSRHIGVDQECKLNPCVDEFAFARTSWQDQGT